MKKSTLMLGLLLAAGFSTTASAHNYNGILGTAAARTDKWYFICSNPNTVKVQFQVKRTAGKPCVKATYLATGQNATSCGARAPAAPINVVTGAGAKFFMVNKSPAKVGTNSYTVVAHCIDNAGVHNPADQTTPQTYTQNQ
jgi:hypothetical protein